MKCKIRIRNLTSFLIEFWKSQETLILVILLGRKFKNSKALNASPVESLQSVEFYIEPST